MYEKAPACRCQPDVLRLGTVGTQGFMVLRVTTMHGRYNVYIPPPAPEDSSCQTRRGP